MATAPPVSVDRDLTEGLRRHGEMDTDRTGLEGLTRRRRSVLVERIADGGARQQANAPSLDVDADVVVLDLQELARQRLS
jgi:hypothetical protein